MGGKLGGRCFACAQQTLKATQRAAATFFRDSQRTASRDTADPAKIEQTLRQCSSKNTRQVRPLLAPVDARADHRPAALRTISLETEGRKHFTSAFRKTVRRLAEARSLSATFHTGECCEGLYRTAFQKSVEQSNTQTAGEVVVTGAGPAQGLSARSLSERSHRGRWSHPCYGLQQGRHVRPGQAEVAMTASSFDCQQVRRDKFGKMRTGG